MTELVSKQHDTELMLLTLHVPPHATFTIVLCVYMLIALVLVSQITETEALGELFP